jgi:hypothetical protein
VSITGRWLKIHNLAASRKLAGLDSDELSLDSIDKASIYSTLDRLSIRRQKWDEPYPT